MKLEPVAWMTYESQARLNAGGNSRGSVPVHKEASNTAAIPLYAIPAGYVLVPVRLLEEIKQSLDGAPMSMRSRGDARIAKDVSALIEGEQ